MQDIDVKWSDDFKGLYKGADPEKCYEELLSLGEGFKPEQVVAFAENPATELHKTFEWDNDIASKMWRLQQARQLVKHLVVVPRKQEVQPMRSFFVTKPNEGYKPTTVIFQKPDEYEALVNRVKTELLNFTNKYSHINEFAELFGLIRTTLEMNN